MKRVFFGMMCAFLVLSLSFVAGAVDDDSLVLYLSFDKLNGDVVEDLSGKGNDGTVTGDADWVQDGRAGAGMLFKEIELDGVVIVKGSESLAIAESLTVEMWVYPNTVGDYRNVLGQIDPLAYFMRSEEHTSELQSHSFISYAVFCLKKKIKQNYFINL